MGEVETIAAHFNGEEYTANEPKRIIKLLPKEYLTRLADML